VTFDQSSEDEIFDSLRRQLTLEPDMQPTDRSNSVGQGSLHGSGAGPLRWVVLGVIALVLAGGGFLVGRVTAPDTKPAGLTNGLAPVEGTDDPAKLLAVALQLHQSGDLKAAEQAYQTVLAAKPDDQFALYNLGLIKQTNGDLAGAIDLYTKALAIDGSMVSALYNRGLAYRDAGKTKEGIADLQAVVDADPQRAAALFNLGNMLIADGNVDAGTKLVDQAVTLDPSLRG
jgi:tetratricopeptide (TPR) repeat protein